jgi:parvulin-like peptidyl-prolyl isomerase
LPDSPESIAQAKAEGEVARVLGHRILRSQLDRATVERLWLAGRSDKVLTQEERRAEQKAALDELIDHQLLRASTKETGSAFPVTETEIDEAVKRLAGRFESPDEMKAQLAAEGVDSEKELRLRLGARLQQQKFVESRIAPQIAVTDAEARAWHEKHAAALARPERLQARQVFLSTLNRDAAEARSLLQKAHDELTAKSKEFAALSSELNEDPRAKSEGGNLGWITRERLPADFSTPVFALPLNRPALVRTKLGWHLVEVTARKAAEPRNYDEAQAEVTAALQSARRAEAVAALRKSLREEHAGAIRVFTDMIPE